jgi:DNA topoisomerase VI subunit B
MEKEVFTRTAFTTDRMMDFFTESELTREIGYDKALWPLVLVKELIDNALDACEGTTPVTAPEINVTLEPDAVTVADNGPGLKPEIIEGSLDYSKRISDNKYYCSPTRGQLGNAFKCVWAASFVTNGTGVIEVMACGLHHRVEVRLNRIAQSPDISHEKTPLGKRLVKNGTSVIVRWPQIASLKPHDQNAEFYQTDTVAQALPLLMANFSTFNPHATFHLRLSGSEFNYPASDPKWLKWSKSQATSAHWYQRTDDLRDLIAAEIRAGSHKTIRDFVGEFDGLVGPQYRKRVLDAAKISETYLDELIVDGDLDDTAVQRLLLAMQKTSRPVKPQRLGFLGDEHLRQALVSRGVSPESFRYKKMLGPKNAGDELPFVIELAFGVKGEDEVLELIIGLNNSPVFKIPSGHIADVLSDCAVQSHEPLVLLIHQTCPQFMFTDRGKGSIV